MKLYKVTIERNLYVLAEDEDDAEIVALDYEGEAGWDDPAFISAQEIQSLDEVDEEWYDGIPYSDSGDYETIKDILTSQKAHDVQDNEGGIINE
jgi:hypothetical protein